MLTLKNSSNNLDLSFNKRKALFPLDIIFYIVFSCVYAYFFLRTTQIHTSYIEKYDEYAIKILRYVGYYLVGYSVFTIVFVCEGFKSRILSLLLLSFSIGYLFHRELDVDFRTIHLTFLFVLCSQKKNPKVLLWSSYIIGWVIILLSFIFSLTGIVPYYIYAPGRRGFGSVYPTDLACHILVLGLTLALVRNGKLKLYDYIWYLIVSVVNLIFMKAKVGLICLLFVLFGAAFYQYVIPYVKIPDLVKRLYKFICIICYPLLAILTIVLSKTYVDTPDNFWRQFKTIRLRLLYGSEAFQNYEVKFWGTWFREVGNGGVPAPHPDYFFIDISYVRILFFNGILALFLVLFLYTLSQIVFIKNEMNFFAYLYLIFSIDCAIEHHIIQIPYGLIFMCLFLSNYMCFSDFKVRKYVNPFVTIPLSIKNKEHKKLVFFNQEKSNK